MIFPPLHKRDYSGPPAFEVIAKPTGPLCNLECRYCYYLGKQELYPGTKSWMMSDDVLVAFIRQMIASQGGPVIRFVWQGGEPTLCSIPFFQHVMELQQRYGEGQRIENVLQTNGVLLDDAWCSFLADHDFLVGLSVDGPRELHDTHRVFKGGQPSFDRVMNGFHLLKKHSVRFNTLTCIHRHNAGDPLGIYRFLRREGSGYIQFIPVVEPLHHRTMPLRDRGEGPAISSDTLVSDRSVLPDQFGRFLCTVFDEWYRHDAGRCFIQTFEVALESWLDLPRSLCVFNTTCGNALVLEHNGDLYPCDHFVSGDLRLGNITTTTMRSMVDSMRQREFGFDKFDTLPAVCHACDVRFACNGECPKNRFLTAPDGSPGLNYLCAAYKQFFHHSARGLQNLASGILTTRHLRITRPD